jgi:small-conductance mechanosensitive channel
VKLLVELACLGSILVLVFSITGAGLVNTLLGIGFFGIVFGLAAQSVLGNLFSGIMLLVSRPFHIGDRIALITWQYGKFPPTLAHGWLEPSYTGIVKGIALTYTRMLTDSNAMVKIPNALVTQSLIMNLSHDGRGYIATQVEVPIRIDPDRLRLNIRRELSKLTGFQGDEQSFEVIDTSATGYLVAIAYRTEKGSERDMKSLLLKGVRLALLDPRKVNTGNK